MKKIFLIMKRLMVLLAGRPNWTPPVWLDFLKKFKSKNPVKFRLAFLSCVVFITAGLAGCILLSGNDDAYLMPVVTGPEITDPGNAPGRVDIVFIKKNTEISGNQPAAAISLIGKKIEEGISIFPHVNGEFKWENDRLLVFYPKDEWPPGKEFQLKFKQKIFSKAVKLKNYKTEFETQAPVVEIENFRFYTDPENRRIHKGVATLSFNYPVDVKSLKDNISLKIKDQVLDYEISFDDYKRHAYIHSSPINIKEVKRYLKLEINKGTAFVSGGAKTNESVSKRIVIPSMESFFKLENINAKIIRDEKNNPVQSVILSFTDRLKLEDLKDKIEIYLLPKREKYKKWNSPSEITDSILKSSVNADFHFAQTKEKTSDSFGLILNVPEKSDIYIKINSGIESESGFYLTKPVSDVLRIPQYPKELDINGTGGILSLSGSKRLSFKTRGLKAVKVEVSRLLDNQLQHLVSQGNGDINRINFSSYYFNKENISKKFEKTIYLNSKNSKEAVYSSLDLSSYLDQNGKKPGFFFIEAYGWNPDKKRRERVSETRTILITDMLIMVKKNADDSRDVFVHSVSKGGPVKGADVYILGKNGLSVVSKKSDKNGHVYFENLNDFADEKRPVACVAKLGSDVSFIEFEKYERRLNLSSFDTGGVRSRYLNPDRVDGFLFSDRGIYRPGESFNIGAIVRHKGFKVPKGIPVEYAVYDSRGNQRLKKQIKVPDSGFFDISYKTQSSDPTGNWSVRLYLVSKKGYRSGSIGYANVKIEEFQPDRLKIKSFLSKTSKGWIKPEKLSAEVSLLNMFGSPAQKRKISVNLKLNPGGFYFKEYKGYKFTDPYYSKDRILKSVNRMLENKKTDKNGKAVFNIDLDSYEKGTYGLTLEVKGYEKSGGRSVTAINKALISPLDNLIGWKSGSDLSYLEKKSDHTISFIAVDNLLNRVSKENLVFKLKKINKVSALVKKRDGTFVYQTVKKEEVKNTKNISIFKKGLEIKPDTTEPGEFAIEIYDNDTLVSRVEYFVAGALNESGNVNKNAQIEIRLKNKDVKQGDYIEAFISAPYKGTGLISIESDKVYSYKWFNVNKKDAVQKIKVPRTIEGNAYICVSMVRAYDDPSIFETPFTYAVKPFYINRSKRTIVPEINVPKKVKPGEKLTIEYSADQKSKIALFAADEGILQAGGYRLPKPLDHFLKKKALEVNTFQIADLILPEYEILRKKLAPGGGMRFALESKRLASNLNPFKRTINDPAVKWFGVLDCDNNKKTVSWVVPDTFTGNVKVMAVAANSDSMGSASKDVLIRGPFAITPSIPNAVTFNDKFKIGISIANLVEGSGKSLPVRIEVKAGKGINLSSLEKTINIDENSEAFVEFDAVAGTNPGNVDFKIFAGSENKSSKTSASLSIRPAVSYKSFMEAGFSKKDKTIIEPKRSLIKEMSYQNIKASDSPVIFADALLNWLGDYPHACTEQAVSKAFANVSIAGLKNNNGDIDNKNLVPVEKAFNILAQRQHSNGGFSMWPGGRVDDFASVYAAHFLIDAKDAGFKVPMHILDRSISWLDSKASERKTDINEKRIRSYAVYLLTRYGKRTSNHLADIEDNLDKEKYEKDIINAFLASSYKLLKDDYSADKKIKQYEFGRSLKESLPWFESKASDPFYIYLLGKHFPNNLKKISVKDIEAVLNPVFNGDFNTISAAYSVMALGAWTSNQDKKISESVFSFEFKKGDDDYKALNLNKGEYSNADFSVNTDKLLIKGKSPYFYAVTQNGYDKELLSKPVSNKIEILRTFENEKGEEITGLRPGQDFYVVLKVRTLTGETEHNIAVTDLFPGGFYPDRDSIRKGQGWNKIDYIDVREDRAVFYSSFSPEVKIIKYLAKASAKGEFTIPCAQAKSMYDKDLYAVTAPGKIIVE